MELRLIQDDPAAGPAPPKVERPPQRSSQYRAGPRVGRGGARLNHQLAVDDLGDHGVRDREQIFVAGAAAGRAGHGPSLTTTPGVVEGTSPAAQASRSSCYFLSKLSDAELMQ